MDVILSVLFILAFVMFLLSAEAAGFGITLGSHSVGIVLSQTCQTLIKNNLSTTCPTYEILEQLDTSEKKVSGSFEYVNGFYQRGPSPYVNSHLWYAFDSSDTWRIFVDPPREYLSRVKLITIENNFDLYYNRADNQIVNHTIIQYHDRFVSSGCWTSTINSDIWLNLLPDTMYYMRNDCNPDFTGFDHVKKIYMNKTEMDISTSYKWQYDKWLADVKKNCIFEYGKC